MAHTFESLGQLPFREAMKLFPAGKAVDVQSLVGWEFRGWNLFPHFAAKGIGRLFNAHRFGKGFFRFPGENSVYGYNIDILHGGLKEEWKERLVNGQPVRRRFFKVYPPAEGPARGGRHLDALFFDYAEGRPRSGYFDGGALRDYFVQAEPSNPDLFLLIAYQMLGPIWIPGGFGIIQRWRRYEYVPTSSPATGKAA
jgi:hypothetical protein